MNGTTKSVKNRNKNYKRALPEKITTQQIKKWKDVPHNLFAR